MTIHHLSFIVDDLEAAAKFYVPALAPLGYEVVRDYPTAKGLGVGGKPDFWIKTGAGGVKGAHIAFVAPSKEAVDQFYAAAMYVHPTERDKMSVLLNAL
jgi:catechol 2,3-dioxygenase-like lactoylglutathione lyase family enzyme